MNAPTLPEETQLDNLMAPYFINRSVKKKTSISKLHAFAMLDHLPSNTKLSNPEFKKVTTERGHIHLHPKFTENGLLPIPAATRFSQICKFSAYVCTLKSEDTCLKVLEGMVHTLSCSVSVTHEIYTLKIQQEQEYPPHYTWYVTFQNHKNNY